jgi:branched-subunit amino acid transport protein
MSLGLTILLAGLATYGIRLSFIFLLNRVSMPPWFELALRFVPIAVLSAIIVPDLATFRGDLVLNPLANPQIIAGAAAALVAWRTRRVLPTILSGFAVLLLLQASLGLASQ